MDLPAAHRLSDVDRAGDVVLDRAEDEAAWLAARRVAQALVTADELLSGLRHHDWRVRYESVDRLSARWHSDARTLPALLEAAVHDPSWWVRSSVVMRLTDFDIGKVRAVVERAAHDVSPDVRWAAGFVLFQGGRGPFPGDLDPCEPGCCPDEPSRSP